VRVLDALQSGELCPCNWHKGEKRSTPDASKNPPFSVYPATTLRTACLRLRKTASAWKRTLRATIF